jgi:hypothetical protein
MARNEDQAVGRSSHVAVANTQNRVEVILNKNIV